jgi:hypothetical protein
MNEREILARTRELIGELAGGDPDKWWYANRFVFARLQLDERKTKAGVKQKLLESNAPCHGCTTPFESRRDIHLHRLNGSKAYSLGNCVLMHADCHRRLHASQHDASESGTPTDGTEPILTKWSKRFDGKPFLYWWDIVPSTVTGIESIDAFEFAKKDTGERCVVPADTLKAFLTPERQTTRGHGNWGIRVLKDHEDALAFEPGGGSGDKYALLPVVWLEESED